MNQYRLNKSIISLAPKKVRRKSFLSAFAYVKPSRLNTRKRGKSKHDIL